MDGRGKLMDGVCYNILCYSILFFEWVELFEEYHPFLLQGKRWTLYDLVKGFDVQNIFFKIF